MPEKTQGTTEKRAGGLQNNWPLLRKFETLIFACMLALLPFFAAKIVDVTTTSLAVKNCAVDLVNDLNRAKALAKDGGVNITVASRHESQLGPPAYLIQDDQRTIEEVVLPKGVVVEGNVKFDQTGKPVAGATFTVTRGPKKARVVVDKVGVISSP